jgi:hypothetical protein
MIDYFIHNSSVYFIFNKKRYSDSSVQIETKQTNVSAKPIIGLLGSEGSNLFFHSSKGQKNTIYKYDLKLNQNYILIVRILTL